MVSDKSKKMDEVLYDWRDMPVRFNLKENGETWNSSVDIVYDAAGNRVLKKEKVEIDGSVTRAKAVAYAGSDMVFENDNYIAGQYSLKYFNIDQEGRMDFPSLTNYYYIKDHLGSTRMVVDESGEAIEANMYDSYGKLSQLVYSGTSTRLREKFTGKELDDEGAVEGETNGLGLYYFGVRYYDPEIGTFTTTDPKDVYHNSYSYCGGDPINNIDPVGADAATIAGAFLLVGLAAVAWFWQNTAEYETPNPLDWDWGDPELISSTAVLAMNLAGTIISEVQMAKAAAAANKQGLRLEDYRGHLMKRASSKSDLVNLVDNSGEANDYGAVTGGGMESTEPSNMVTGSGEAMFKAPSSVTELIQDFLAWREANFQWFVANFGEPTPIYTIGNQNYYAADMLPLGGGIKIIQGVKIAELLKGTGQIPALLRNPNLKGVNVQELLTKTIDEAKQLLNKQQFKTLLKHFEGRDLRHGK